MLSKTRRLDVTYDFGPKLSKLVGTLSAGGPPVVVGDLLKLFGIKVRKGFPNSLAEAKGVDLAQGRLELDFANNAVQLSGDNSLKQAAFAYAERVGSAWRLALGVAMAAGWKMADLSSALKNVDEFLSFEQVFVALATDSLLIDDTVFARMGAHRFQLLEGLNVGAVIALDARQGSPLAQALRGLLGGDMQIFLEASLGPKPDEISFSAALGGELDIKLVVPGEKKRATLGIKSPTLKFTLEPSLSLSGEVTFPATDGTVDITGGIDITPTSLAFRGHAHDPDLRLAPPKQAAGLVLQDIGGVIKAAPGALEIGLDGTMAIGADQAAFAFAFAMPEMFPAFLYARFDSLDLAPMFKALCKARQLPKPLSKGIVFREVTIWSCEDPSGRCTFSDGRHVASGFAFAGQATVFGFPADAALAITTAGMSGRLSMGCSVSVPGVFTVSDATDHSKGPQFAFNTTRTPYLRADYYIDVLGVKDTAQLQFTNEGFSLDTSVTFKQRKIRFHCVLGAPSGRYVVEIDGTGDFRKAPIPVYSSKLVTLKLSYVDIRFSSTSGFFSVRADGKLGAIPKSAHVQISLGEIGHKLEQLGRELEQELGNVKNWL